MGVGKRQVIRMTSDFYLEQLDKKKKEGRTVGNLR